MQVPWPDWAEHLYEGLEVIGVCDAWDAMVTDRPYRRGTDSESALAELRRCAGTQFDPAVVAAFCAVMSRVEIARVAVA
jgi:HD-GYP domain-containing protein (c-di-GMP phosphodiesterase class II)